MSRVCNKENMRKVVTALRSGEYKQTTGALKVDDSFCCLGVATDIYQKETGEGQWEDFSNEIGTVLFQTSSLCGAGKTVLPKRVGDWLGLRAVLNIPLVDVDDNIINSASIYNDDGFTFEHIADLIEQEYLND